MLEEPSPPINALPPLFPSSSKTYHKPIQFVFALGRYDSTFDFLAVVPRYLDLAAQNLDHFGPVNAQNAYIAGHQVAMETAAAAGAMVGGRFGILTPEATVLLNRAYAMDAFACHFLTDLFSAGHVRVPREELDSVTNGDSYVRAMHNEDGRTGVNVRDGLGHIWAVFGDNSLFFDRSKANQVRAQAAVDASVNEIAAAFAGSSVFASRMNLYFPTPVSGPNNRALFELKNGSLYARGSPNDPTNQRTTSRLVTEKVASDFCVEFEGDVFLPCVPSKFETGANFFADDTICLNNCTTANDGKCQDSGSNSTASSCAFGTDCGDCGIRYTGK